MSSAIALQRKALALLEEEDDDWFECVVPPRRGLTRDAAQFIELWVESQDVRASADAVWGRGCMDGKKVLRQLMCRPAARLYAHDLRAFYYRRIFETREDIIVEIEAMLADQACKGKLRVRLFELLARLLVPKMSATVSLSRTEVDGVPQEKGLTADQISIFRHQMLGMDRALVGAADTTARTSRTGRPHPIDVDYEEKPEDQGDSE